VHWPPMHLHKYVPKFAGLLILALLRESRVSVFSWRSRWVALVRDNTKDLHAALVNTDPNQQGPPSTAIFTDQPSPMRLWSPHLQGLSSSQIYGSINEMSLLGICQRRPHAEGVQQMTVWQGTMHRLSTESPCRIRAKFLSARMG
jgi:hypothetical protein